MKLCLLDPRKIPELPEEFVKQKSQKRETRQIFNSWRRECTPNPLDIIIGVPDQRRHVQVEQDDVVVVKFAEIAPLFTQVGRIDVEALRLQHQLNRLSGGAVVLSQQNAHADRDAES